MELCLHCTKRELQRFQAEREALFARRGRLGVLLKTDEAVENIGADAERLALVMVQFPRRVMTIALMSLTTILAARLLSFGRGLCFQFHGAREKNVVLQMDVLMQIGL